MGRGNRFAAAGIVDRDQIPEQHGRVLLRRPPQNALYHPPVAAPLPADAYRGPLPPRICRTQGQHRDPRPQQVRSVQLGERHLQEPLAVHTGDGAGETTAAAQIDVHVVGVRGVPVR